MAEVRIRVTAEPGSGMFTDFTHGLDAATSPGSTLRFTCQYRSALATNAVSLPWIFYSPDNSITTGVRIENPMLVGKWATRDVWFFGPQLRTELIDGVLPDQMATVGIGGLGEPNTGGGGFQDTVFDDFIEWTVSFDSTGIICFDSSFFLPGLGWLAVDFDNNSLGPLWFGGNGDLSVGGTRTEAYCVNVLERNCCATPGDANHDDKMNIADITYILSRIFLPGAPPACCREADPNGDGRMNVGDVVYLILRIFAGGPPPVCGGPVESC